MAAALALAATACDGGATDPFTTVDGFEGFRADGPHYLLEPTGIAGGLGVEIPFSYTNTSRRALYLENCNGHVGPDLQKRTRGGWATVWGAGRDDCLSRAIVIPPGETFRSTLRVAAYPPGSEISPSFSAAEISGTYRMVWLPYSVRVLWSSDPAVDHMGYPVTPQVVPAGLRVSVEFTLEAPPWDSLDSLPGDP